MKKWLVYVLGIVTGIVLTLVALLVIDNVISNQDPIESDPRVFLFEKPGEVMNFKSFEVFQVLTSTSALAHASEKSKEPYSYVSGTVVYLLPEPNIAYYDDQIIKVPAGKVVRQVGTYRYETRNETIKTVPIVKILDK